MRILLVENHAAFVATVVPHFLAEHDVTVCASIADVRALPSLRSFDAVLVDYDLGDGKGDAVVTLLRDAGYDGRVVAISARDEGNAALVRAGADDRCPKARFDRIVQHLP